MNKTSSCWGAMLGLFLTISPLLRAENVTIRVHLYKGAWAEGQPGLGKVILMTRSSYPALEALRLNAGHPEPDFTAATIDALLEAQELKTVDDIFAFAMDWNGRDSELSQDITHKTLGAFRFDFKLKRLSPQGFELAMIIDKSKEPVSKDGKAQLGEAIRARWEGRFERILDTKLPLKVGEPVIVGFPAEQDSLFLMVCLKTSNLESAAPKKPAAEQSLGTRLTAVHTILPAYPEELRQKGVQGQVEAQVVIDEEGAVLGVEITKSLHPYLDFSAVQALRQWTFEPTKQNGKPVTVVASLVVKFDPETYRLLEEKSWNQEGKPLSGATSQEGPLSEVLNRSAEYCQKLTGAALDFICEERIKEIHYNFAKNLKWAGISVSPKGGGGPISSTAIPLWDPAQTQTYDYTCDYLFIRKGDVNEERRIILKDNGRKMPDRNRLLEEKRFTALNPLMAATRILGRDRQPLFNFRIIDKDSVHGHKAYVLEAIPRSGNTWGVEYAKIWVDQDSSQILRSEIRGVPLEGYDDVLKETTQFSVTPVLTTTHTYEVEKQGVYFPKHTSIRVAYPQPGTWLDQNRLKLKIDMAYDKYKFFTVETESDVKK
jgi:TonB family protein